MHCMKRNLFAVVPFVLLFVRVFYSVKTKYQEKSVILQLKAMLDKNKLIEMVKNYTFLYDKDDKRYGDNDKNAAWKEIGRKLRAPADECRRTWTLMRDSLRRSLKKQMENDKNNVTETDFKKFKYADEMEFLQPYFRYRPRAHKKEEDDDSYFRNDKQNSRKSNNKITFVGIASEEPNEETQVEQTTEEPEPKRPKPYVSCDVNKVAEESAFSTLLKTIVDGKRNGDQIDQFFASVASTVRSFPAEDKIIAKAKVFELITTMELEILNKYTIENESIHEH